MLNQTSKIQQTKFLDAYPDESAYLFIDTLPFVLVGFTSEEGKQIWTLRCVDVDYFDMLKTHHKIWYWGKIIPDVPEVPHPCPVCEGPMVTYPSRKVKVCYDCGHTAATDRNDPVIQTQR